MKQWRDTEYYVSEDGDVYRYGRKKAFHISNKGYNVVDIWQFNKRTKFYIHRIVAELYLENSNSKPFVNHIDGNKLNNHYTNLEWVSAQENSHHSLYTLKKGIGNNHPQTKIPDRIVSYLRRCKSLGIKPDFDRIAKTYEVTKYHVSRIYYGRKRVSRVI